MTKKKIHAIPKRFKENNRIARTCAAFVGTGEKAERATCITGGFFAGYAFALSEIVAACNEAPGARVSDLFESRLRELEENQHLIQEIGAPIG